MPFDVRDVLDDPTLPFAKLPMPYAPRDQKNVNCCTSCAVATAMESLDARRPDREPGGGHDPVEVQRGRATELSPVFLHFQATGRRAGDNTTNTGLSVYEAMYYAASGGICPAKYHLRAISLGNLAIQPSDKARTHARHYRLLRKRRGNRWRKFYNQLSNADRVGQWKALLLKEYPVLAVFRLSAAYKQLGEREPDGTPINVRHPEYSRLETGKHCVAVLGFSDQTQAFYVVDSRGQDWGYAGAWWLPYTLTDSEMVTESWTINEIIYD